MLGIALLGLLPAAVSAQPSMPKGFVFLSDVAPAIRQDMRYAGTHNFMGRPAAGYKAAECILTSAASTALARVQKSLETLRMSLIVWDCYRPHQAVMDFVKWSKDPSATGMKGEFFPSLDKASLFPRYIAQRSGHSRGSTVDLGIVPSEVLKTPVPLSGQEQISCAAPKGKRYDDLSIDLGTGFDCFDRRAAADSPEIGAAARKNRRLLRSAMESGGFRGYAAEWWHFQLAKEPFPDREFDFPIMPKQEPTVTPVPPSPAASQPKAE